MMIGILAKFMVTSVFLSLPNSSEYSPEYCQVHEKPLLGSAPP